MPAEVDQRTGPHAVTWNGCAHPERLSNSHALLAAIELHDPYTAQHSRNTVRLAKAVARRFGMTPHERSEVALVAMLHDVGKLGMPDHVLNKRGPLTLSEHRLVRQHPAAGARVIEQVEELAHLAPAIRAGHERWDGAGYPDGLAGEEIPLVSRITFVCDAYDAMTSDRPYRRAMSDEWARTELRRCAGSQFWSPAVDALLEALESSDAPAVTVALAR